MAHPVTTPEPDILTLRPHLLMVGDLVLDHDGMGMTVTHRPHVRARSVAVTLTTYGGSVYLRHYTRAELLTVQREA